MKIQKRIDAVLRTGDKVTVSVTHEIKIQGDSSWVKYEATSLVQDETTEQAASRVINHVNDAAMSAVRETVNRVNGVVNQ